MKSFALYFLEKRLSEETDLILSESTNLDELYAKGILKGRKKALKSFLDELKLKYINTFYEKFPKVQYEDIEDAFHDAIKKITEEKPKTDQAIEKIFKNTMTKSLSEVSKKKKDIRKNLSCVKVIKSTKSSIGELMRRAEKILTSREKKIIELCAEGKNVREIGKKLKISAVTAWRSLNSGLDKLRLSHGMRSRKLG
jgi:ATP/maltotriose-dependent transcriptional regulator MalT